MQQPSQTSPPDHKPWWRQEKQLNRISIILTIFACVILIASVTALFIPGLKPETGTTNPTQTIVPTPTPSPTPIPFDPNVNAVLPTSRVIAFYGIPGASAAGPAFELSETMLQQLKDQGAAFEQIDPEHPVKLGIDLVASIPDPFPGPTGNYSHRLDEATIQAYVDFCEQNDLLLFLDLNFGQAPVMEEFDYFRPYLEQYDFVHLAIDPEWMFPRRDGIPGTHLSNVRASDINPMLEAVAEIPMEHKVPRKMVIFHQYRPNGDEMENPFDPGHAEIADKRNLLNDPRMDLVIHVDSVGGYPGDIEDKQMQYEDWVKDDMEKYDNFQYGGFKIFYDIESRTRIMTPEEILAMDPPPMVITYGN